MREGAFCSVGTWSEAGHLPGADTPLLLLSPFSDRCHCHGKGGWVMGIVLRELWEMLCPYLPLDVAGLGEAKSLGNRHSLVLR